MPRPKKESVEIRYKKELPTRLRKLKEDLGLTDEAIANASGIARQSVGYYMNGERTPDAYTLAKIAKALGVSCDYLLGLSDVPTLDKDIKAAAELTGLSSKAVEALAILNDNKQLFYDVYEEYNPTIDALNLILEDMKERGDREKEAKQGVLISHNLSASIDDYKQQIIEEFNNSLKSEGINSYKLVNIDTQGYKETLKQNDLELLELHRVAQMQINVFRYLMDYVTIDSGGITLQNNGEEQSSCVEVMINGIPRTINLDFCYISTLRDLIMEELRDLKERNNGKHNNEE